jgi:O-acetyl-ADP-ribose deacetylase (regulator of RNase III)
MQNAERLRDGEGKHTSGYDLPANFVIHTVGVIWAGGNYQEAELLASCYRECMAIAKARGFKSIAFPAISCGVYGYPITKACEIAIVEVKKAIVKDSTIQKVIFACFSDESEKALNDALAKSSGGNKIVFRVFLWTLRLTSVSNIVALCAIMRS